MSAPLGSGKPSSGGNRSPDAAAAVIQRDRPADRYGHGEIRNVVECLLLARGGPVRLSDLRKVLDVDEAELRATLAALQVEYEGRGLQIQEIAGGYQLCTRPEYADAVQRLLRLGELEPLSRATLEVLAIVAYRQPVTRAEVDAIRGIHSVHHLVKLQERYRQKLVILGISEDEIPPEQVKAFAANMKVNYVVAMTTPNVVPTAPSKPGRSPCPT